MFNYEISNVQLEKVFDIRDLGVVFDRTVSCTAHIDFIVSKAYSRCLAAYDENMR